MGRAEMAMRGWLVALLLATAMALGALSVRADTALGLRAFEQGDYVRAWAELEPAAQSGDAQAQFVLGVMALAGVAAARDAQTAIGWLERAAEAGHLGAQMELARIYREGDGVAQDLAAMAHWYERAARQGDVGAQLFIADAYAFGYGVARDPVRALAWYRVAARYWGDVTAPAEALLTTRMAKDEIAAAEGLAAELAPPPSP